jgi:hypothetical protein
MTARAVATRLAVHERVSAKAGTTTPNGVDLLHLTRHKGPRDPLAAAEQTALPLPCLMSTHHPRCDRWNLSRQPA